MEDLNNNENPNNNEGNNIENQNDNLNNQSQKNGESNAQVAQNINTNNEGTTNNANTKKKSKAPIIIVVVLIVVLLCGCITIGGASVVIPMFINSSENVQKNRVENIIKNLDNSVNNSSINSVTNNAKNNNTIVSKNNLTTNNTNVNNNTVNKSTNSNAVNNSTNSNAVNNNISNSSEVVDAKSSTKENPLGKGVWGIASKYSTQSKENEDVYIKVTNITRGEEAKKIVQDYINSKSYLKYEEPKEGLEWVVLDYDLDFANYTKSSYGANAEITASIKGIGDSSSVKYNGVTYILSSRYIGSADYVKTQDAKGKIAFQMPIGCKDYIVQFGTTSSTNAYFKCE